MIRGRCVTSSEESTLMVPSERHLAVSTKKTASSRNHQRLMLRHQSRHEHLECHSLSAQASTLSPDAGRILPEITTKYIQTP